MKIGRFGRKLSSVVSFIGWFRKRIKDAYLERQVARKLLWAVAHEEYGTTVLTVFESGSSASVRLSREFVHQLSEELNRVPR